MGPKEVVNNKYELFFQEVWWWREDREWHRDLSRGWGPLKKSTQLSIIRATKDRANISRGWYFMHCSVQAPQDFPFAFILPLTMTSTHWWSKTVHCASFFNSLPPTTYGKSRARPTAKKKGSDLDTSNGLFPWMIRVSALSMIKNLTPNDDDVGDDDNDDVDKLQCLIIVIQRAKSRQCVLRSQTCILARNSNGLV